MLKNVIRVIDSEHRKVHFLESDFFELAIQKRVWSFSKRVWSFSKTVHLTWKFMMFSEMMLWLGLFTFWSSPNSGNSLLFELADLKFDSEINKSKES